MSQVMDRWSDRLSEYLDGELSGVERRELEAHLAGCESCRQTLEDLARVVERAGSLEDRPPARDLWRVVADRIASGQPAGSQVVELASRRTPGRRHVSFSLPQLAAASVALVILSSAAGWFVATRSGLGTGAQLAVASRGAAATSPESAAVRGAPIGAPGAQLASSSVDEKYAKSIAELERVLEERRSELDPQTVRVIEENLRLIDGAIDQARRALAEDPASEYLKGHLATTMEQKLELLRQATSLAGSSS